jgi:hypothetical protein
LRIDGNTTGAYAFALLDLASATVFAPGTVQSGALNPGNSTALYAFNANAGDKVFFDMQSVDNSDSSWRLISPTGDQRWINGLGTDHHIFKSGDTTEPIKNPLRANAAPCRLDRPKTSNSSKTTPASPPCVRKIHSAAGPMWEACTANSHSRFKSECHTPQAKSSSTVAKTSKNDWARKDKRGAELNSGRIRTFRKQAQIIQTAE